MPDQAPIPETINEIILRIINLESLDGVSYDEYYGLLLEQIALIEDDQSDLSSKEIKIIQEEAKVIGPFAKKNPDDMVNERFNVKKRAVNTDKLFKNKKKPTVKTTSKKGLIPKKVLTDSDSKNNQDILTSILGSVNNILQILQNQSSFERKVYNKNLREKEQEENLRKIN